MKSKWFYKPHNKWFENRKQVKDYLGGISKFNHALKNKDVIFITYTNIIYLDR